MKKFFAFAAAVAFVATMSSCKKEYECCWYDNGVKDTDSLCTISKMKKSDADATYVKIGTSEFKCEPN